MCLRAIEFALLGKGAQASSFDVTVEGRTQSSHLKTELPGATGALLVVIAVVENEQEKTVGLASEL